MTTHVMYTILDRRMLAEGIFKIRISAPLIAEKFKAGQFVVLMVNETGERIPLTIVDGNVEDGSITLIFQKVGKTTALLAARSPSDELFSVLGPLGRPSTISKFGTVVVAGGGVGVAEIYPVAKALNAAGNYVIGLAGFRTASKMFMVGELIEHCNELYISTDDGSIGYKGFVHDALRSLLEKKNIDYVYAVGPVPMMKAVSDVTRPFNIKTVISANPLMIDGTGMCGVCRLEVGGIRKLACVDGPEFDGHQVDFGLLEARLRAYKDEEHACRLQMESKSDESRNGEE
ncbi:MAG: sulfide/dihydroorotate dehydrogenase-like FAD/NAD-binding protein [Nitrososphaeria archaeon]